MSVLQVMDRPIAFQRHFVRITGSINAALMLSQAVYWSQRVSLPGGWFYKTQAEWEDETGLTRREQDGARKLLLERGLIREEKRGVPAKIHYQVQEEILEGVCTKPPTCMHQTANLYAPNRQRNTESTSETTHKNKNMSGFTGPTLFGEPENTKLAIVDFKEEVVEDIYKAYPRKEAPADARKSIRKALANVHKRPRDTQDPSWWLLERVKLYARKLAGSDRELIPHPATWFNRESFDEDPKDWYPRKKIRGSPQADDDPPEAKPQGRGWKTGNQIAQEKAEHMARIRQEEANG